MAGPVDTVIRRYLALALAAMALGGSPALAQPLADSLFDLPAYGPLKPSGGFSATRYDPDSTETVLLYAVGQRIDPKAPLTWEWVARRSDTRAPEVVTWAHSATCKALADVVHRMSAIAPATFDLPGLRPRSPIRRYMADGTRYIVWSNGGAQADGSPIEVFMVGTGGGLETWAIQSQEALKPCWSSDAPPPPKY